MYQKMTSKSQLGDWIGLGNIIMQVSFLFVVSASVSQETLDDWSSRLPDIASGYDACDVFNMDDTGLFFRALPDKSLSVP